MSPATPYSTIDVPGVYLITHTASGKVYVGSSSRSIGDRWTQHRWDLRRNIHINKYLQRAWNKYGEDAFSFAVLETVSNPDLVLEREQVWLDYYMALGRDGCYNIAPNAHSTRGMKLSPEHCAAIGARKRGVKQSPETIARRAASHRGQKRSEAARKAMSEAARRRSPMSAETRKKLSDANKGKRPPQSVIDGQAKTYEGFISPDGVVYRNVTNLRAFIKEHGLGDGIYHVEHGRAAEYKGWRRITPLVPQGRNNRVFSFISPDGAVYTNIRNLKAFCKEYALSPAQMSKVYRGLRSSHRGWKRVEP